MSDRSFKKLNAPYREPKARWGGWVYYRKSWHKAKETRGLTTHETYARNRRSPEREHLCLEHPKHRYLTCPGHNYWTFCMGCYGNICPYCGRKVNVKRRFKTSV